MKILFVTLHSSRIGKANLDVFNPAIELAKRGHSVHIISRDDLGSSSEIPLDIDGARVYPVAFQSALRSFIFLPLFALRVFRIAAKIEPDLIIAENNLHCPFVGYVVAKLQKRPLLILLRELTADALYYDKSRSLLKRGLAWLMMKAGHFLLSRVKHKVAINSGIAKYYTEVLGQEIPSVWLLGFDLSRFDCDEAILQQVASKYGLQPDKIKLLYTGTLALERGLGSVFQALSCLPDSNRLQLLITGEGKALNILKREASRLGISESVSFLGWLTTRELDALLCLADVGIEPYSRPWPQDHTPSSKVASYAAAGLFVLATEAFGYREIIVNGENGYLYSKTDELEVLLEKYINHQWPSRYRNIEAHRDKVSVISAVDSLERILNQASAQER